MWTQSDSETSSSKQSAHLISCFQQEALFSQEIITMTAEGGGAYIPVTTGRVEMINKCKHFRNNRPDNNHMKTRRHIAAAPCDLSPAQISPVMRTAAPQEQTSCSLGKQTERIV